MQLFRLVLLTLALVLVNLNVAFGKEVEASEDVPQIVDVENEEERDLYGVDPNPTNDDDDNGEPEPTFDFNNLFQAIKETSGLASFKTLVVRAQMAPALRDRSEDYAVFAPTDTALNNFPTACLQRAYNRANLIEFVKFHISKDPLSRKNLLGVKIDALSLMSDKLSIDGKDRESENVIMLMSKDVENNDNRGRTSFVQQKESDIVTKNGFLHGIEPAQVPPSLIMTHWEYGESKYTVFFAMVKEAGVIDLGKSCNGVGRAIFAPTDGAWINYAKELDVYTSKSSIPADLKKYYSSQSGYFLNLVKHHFGKRPVTEAVLIKKAALGKGVGTESTMGGVRPVMDGGILKLAHSLRLSHKAEVKYKTTVAVGIFYEVDAVLVPAKIDRYNIKN